MKQNQCLELTQKMEQNPLPNQKTVGNSTIEDKDVVLMALKLQKDHLIE